MLLTGLKWLRRNLSTTRYDLTPTGQRGKLYEKIFFTFDFHILPEHRRICDKIFPCRCISIKNGDHPWGRCWPIYLESKPSLNCWIAVESAEITFISIHINANQNSYHDDKSILWSLTRALCPHITGFDTEACWPWMGPYFHLSIHCILIAFYCGGRGDRTAAKY